MESTKRIRNKDIETVWIGIPEGHKHIRVCIKLKDELTVIFQEATIANILRGYITVKTHPTTKAQELELQVSDETSQREGYALHQLLETSRSQDEIKGKLTDCLEESTPNG